MGYSKRIAMNNIDGLYDQVYNNMQLKTTEELKVILAQNDHQEWTDTALEIVKRILIERTGTLPELPNSSGKPETLPPDWEKINWQDLSNKIEEKYGKTGGLNFALAFSAFVPILVGTIIFFSSTNKNHDIDKIGILFLIGAILFGTILWSYIRFQRADLLVAKARVLVKTRSHWTYRYTDDVTFALKPVYSLSDGELHANEEWVGHRILFMTTHLFDRFEEQEVYNLVLISTKQVIGLVEDFVDEE
jgi:hypothetical protein